MSDVCDLLSRAEAGGRTGDAARISRPAIEKGLAGRRIEKFYYLSRSALVKDERNLDRLDRVFGHVIQRRSPRAPLPINCAACMA
jgi:hypothetical protein